MSLSDPQGNYPPDDSYPGNPQNSGYDQRGPDDRYGDEPQTYGDYDDQPYRKHEGLPPVHSDPFADDPFQQQQMMMQRSRTPTSLHDQYGKFSFFMSPPLWKQTKRSNLIELVFETILSISTVKHSYREQAYNELIL